VQLKILGPMEVVADGRPVDVGSPKQRAVLAMLVIEANRVVSLDRLIDQLWGDEPPAQATGSLQVYIANLRRALEPERPARAPAGVLVTQPPGYLIRVDPANLDAACFEHLAAEGRQLAGQGHPAAAVDTLTEALTLWRGPALAEFAFESFAQAEIARLEERHWLALEDRVDALLTLGQHAESVAELEHLVGERPLRERLRALFMVALYRSGRQAEALRAFGDARRTLAEELGIDPGPALQRLEVEVLQQAPSLDWHPVAHQPAPARSPDPRAPVAESRGSSAVLVGRDEHLAVLEAALADVIDGRGRMVLLSGEPGIGKTALADALGHRALTAGVEVLWGRCYEGQGAPPFWPWTQILRELLANRSSEELRASLGAGGADLAQLVPEIKDVLGAVDPPPALDPDAARFRLYDSATRFLQRAGATTPLVLVLDDLHWADAASLRLLQFLAGLRSAHLLVVGTYRDVEVVAGQALAETLGALAGEPGVLRLALYGLDRDEVAAYITTVTGAAVAEAVATNLHDRTEGNPFFVEELVRLLASEGRLGPDAPIDEDLGHHLVPAGVGDTIRRRLGRLPADAQTVLTMASVVGREFELDVLAEACQLETERVVDLVESALVTGFVTECPDTVGRLRFSHALVRQTLYDGLSALRRARLHLRIGEALEALGGAERPERRAELAHHFLQAAPAGGADRAVRFATAAAAAAVDHLAYEEAAQYFDQALGVLDIAGGDARSRYDLLCGLGRAHKAAGDRDRARAALQQAATIARGLGDADLLARVAMAFSGGNWWGWWSAVGLVDTDAVSLLEEAARALGRGDSLGRVAVLGRLASELYFGDDVARRRALADEAVDMARRLGRDDALGKALRDRHVAIWGPENPAERLAVAHELVAVAVRAGRRDLEYIGRTFRLVASLELGDSDTADAEMEASEAFARELREPVLLGHIGWGHSMKSLMEGRFTEAEAQMHDNLAATRRFNPAEAQRTFAGQVGQLYEQQGRMAELEPTVRSYIDADPAHKVWRSALAVLLAEDGRLDEAREHFEVLARHDFTDIPRDVAWLFGLAARAEVCTLLGDAARAALLYDLLVPHADQVIVLFTRPLFAGAVAHYLGLLATLAGRLDDAEAHFRAAIVVHERMKARPYLARSQLGLAQLLHRRGTGDDGQEAASLCADVATAAREMGMARLLQRVTELTN